MVNKNPTGPETHSELEELKDQFISATRLTGYSEREQIKWVQRSQRRNMTQSVDVCVIKGNSEYVHLYPANTCTSANQVTSAINYEYRDTNVEICVTYNL